MNPAERQRIEGELASIREQGLYKTERVITTPQSAAIRTDDGREVLKRLKALPGFGDQKARIFVALLGKQYGYDGAGWREAAGAYGEAGSFKSVADIVDDTSLSKVRDFKKQMKAAAKAKAAESD